MFGASVTTMACNAVTNAQQRIYATILFLGFHVSMKHAPGVQLDRLVPPKAEVTRSNRVGCATFSDVFCFS